MPSVFGSNWDSIDLNFRLKNEESINYEHSLTFIYNNYANRKIQVRFNYFHRSLHAPQFQFIVGFRQKAKRKLREKRRLAILRNKQKMKNVFGSNGFFASGN